MFNFLRVLRQPLFPCLASSERDSMSASGVCTQSISIVSFAVCSRQIDLGLLVLVFFFFYFDCFVELCRECLEGLVGVFCLFFLVGL